MGEIVGLCIGSYEFLSRKNTFGDLLSIFSQDDLTIEEVFDKELDESITRRYFTTTVNNAKMCLDVMGHTTLKAKSLFEYHKKNYLDYLEEDFDDEVDSDNIERKYTFENWARAVKKYSSILASDIYENGDYISLENWEMIDTINEATSSAIIYSIAETAKANNLKPFDYFEYLLTEIPKHAEDKNTDFLTEFLPWSKSLLEHIRKSKKAVEK